MPHLIFVLFTALVISVAMAAVAPRQRIYVALRTFVWCFVAVVGGSWVMRLIHG